jgi:hypothetical protein
MRLTIIPEDKSVGKDGKFYVNLSLDSANIPSNIHALQWGGDAGWIEFKSTEPNEDISELPGWAVKCVEIWDEVEYLVQNPPPPTPDEIKAKIKSEAESLLQQSDWTMLQDVELLNKTEWAKYRSQLRAIALNPQVDSAFPDRPPEVWA